MALITSMKEAKEKQVERRAAEMRKSMPKASTRPLTPIADEGNTHGYMTAIPNM